MQNVCVPNHAPGLSHPLTGSPTADPVSDGCAPGSARPAPSARPVLTSPAQQSTPLTPIPADLTGAVAVVTGATAGIGREVAHGLALLGAHVVLVGRTQQRADAGRQELVSRGVPAGQLETAVADLSRPAEVAAAARKLAAGYPKLDILVNNAGCYPAARVLTPDGIEESWATNVLAYEAFTTVLRPSLEAAAGRIVYVSSSMAGGLDLDDLTWTRRRFGGMAAYKQSKQADRMLAWSWQRRLAGSGVIINVAHPDGTATSIANRQKGLWGVITRWAFSTQRPPSEGADTPLWLAASPAVEGHGGGFYVRRSWLDCEFRSDVDGCDHLWKLTQEQLSPYL